MVVTCILPVILISCSLAAKSLKAIVTLLPSSPTTEDEIITIAQSFASGKAAGYDNIPMSIIKESIQIISGPLAHIMNLSIAHGVVPDQMKIARVVPLFKADDQSLFTNYRPVSVLPSFSKFLERIIYNRLYDYLTNLHVINSSASGKTTLRHLP